MAREQPPRSPGSGPGAPESPRARADRLAANLDRGRRGQLVDVETVAFYLDVTRDYVYAHAAELGARRLGGGKRPRLRFDLAELDRRLDSCSEVRAPAGDDSPASGAKRPRPRPARAGASADLLPIRGGRASG
jgi:hypothetical protein